MKAQYLMQLQSIVKIEVLKILDLVIAILGQQKSKNSKIIICI